MRWSDLSVLGQSDLASKGQSALAFDKAIANPCIYLLYRDY